MASEGGAAAEEQGRAWDIWGRAARAERGSAPTLVERFMCASRDSLAVVRGEGRVDARDTTRSALVGELRGSAQMPWCRNVHVVARAEDDGLLDPAPSPDHRAKAV